RVTQALDLAFADREAYVGDPKFVQVPTAALLSDEYAARQRARMDPRRALGGMPQPGDPLGSRVHHTAPPAARGATAMAPDTIYAAVMDRHGNAYSATLSDPSYDTPVIPGLGMAISSRGQQSRLAAGHPAQVAPGKRPRLTPSPALARPDATPSIWLGPPGSPPRAPA